MQHNQRQSSLKAFSDLSAHEIYRILQLRNDVFVLEQACLYQDADGLDPDCLHLQVLENDTLVAYCRLVPPGIKYEEWSIGRVVTARHVRKSGMGRELLALALKELSVRNAGSIRISAQQYLEKFYLNQGFRTVSIPYLEDNIPHIEMLHSSANLSK